MTTALSPKLKMLRGSWRRTLVSRTKFFRISGVGGTGRTAPASEVKCGTRARGKHALACRPAGRSDVPDLDDRQLHLAPGALHQHLVALRLAQQGLAHRGIHADPASLGVGL